MDSLKTIAIFIGAVIGGVLVTDFLINIFGLPIAAGIIAGCVIYNYVKKI